MTGAQVQERVGWPVPDLAALAAVAGVEVLFLVGVVLRADQARLPDGVSGLELVGTLLSFVLPLVLYGAVRVVLAGRRDRRDAPGQGPVALATVLLAAAGLLLYVSPWGRAGIAALLES